MQSPRARAGGGPGATTVALSRRREGARAEGLGSQPTSQRRLGMWGTGRSESYFGAGCQGLSHLHLASGEGDNAVGTVTWVGPVGRGTAALDRPSWWRLEAGGQMRVPGLALAPARDRGGAEVAAGTGAVSLPCPDCHSLKRPLGKGWAGSSRTAREGAGAHGPRVSVGEERTLVTAAPQLGPWCALARPLPGRVGVQDPLLKGMLCGEGGGGAGWDRQGDRDRGDVKVRDIETHPGWGRPWVTCGDLARLP